MAGFEQARRKNEVEMMTAAHLEVASVHVGPLTHGQEVRQCCALQQDINRHLPSESSIQQISEDVDVGEDVHHHCYHLKMRTNANAQVGLPTHHLTSRAHAV